jgi:hypothetical protein
MLLLPAISAILALLLLAGCARKPS